MLVSCLAKADEPSAKIDERITFKITENVKLSTDWSELPIVEPHISAHPSDPNILLVAGQLVNDIDRPYESCQLLTYHSEDGGQTWLEQTHDWYGYDPWSTILPDGAAIVSWIGNKGSFQHSFPIRLLYSGATLRDWDSAVQTLPGNHDGTKLATLNSHSYFTTVKFRDDMGADVMVYRNSGKGEFELMDRIDGKGVRLNFCEPTILSDGTLIVPYAHYQKEIWVNRYSPLTGQIGEPVEVSTHSGGAQGYMSFVADNHTESKFNNSVYFVRALSQSSGKIGVWFNSSKNGGLTWSEDTRIDLYDEAKVTKAKLATVAVNDDGVIMISWVDSQEEIGANDIYCTASFDGGASFSRPQRVSSTSSSPKTHGNADVANKFSGGGHYMGITAKADGKFQLVWADSRTGVFQLYTSEVAVYK